MSEEKSVSKKDEYNKAMEGIDKQIEEKHNKIKKHKAEKSALRKSFKGENLPARRFLGVPVPSLKTISITALVLGTIAIMVGLFWPTEGGSEVELDVEV